MSWDDLLATAAAQHGYFTTAQAAEHGISRRALTWRAQHGSAERVGHGLYRLPHWPAGPDDELHALQTVAPLGTFSHETALTLLGLSDIIPSAVHLTIPETSRLRSRSGVTLHRSRGPRRTGPPGRPMGQHRASSPAGAREGADPDQLVSAARDARERAMLTPADLAELRRRAPFADAGL
jgi:hypothetical protein